MQTCPHCGNQVEDGLKRCPYCRAKLDGQPDRTSESFSEQTYGQEVRFERKETEDHRRESYQQPNRGHHSESIPQQKTEQKYYENDSWRAEREPVRPQYEEEQKTVRPQSVPEEPLKKKKEKKVRPPKEQKPKKEKPKKEKPSKKEQKTQMEQAFDKLDEENGENYSSEMYQPNAPKYEEQLPVSPYEKTLKLVAVIMTVGAVALVALYYI